MKFIHKIFENVAGFYGYVPLDDLHDAENRFDELDDTFQKLAREFKSLLPLEGWAQHAGFLAVRSEINSEKKECVYELQVDLDRLTEVFDGMGLILTQKPDIEIDITDQIQEPAPQSIDVGAGGDWAGVPTPETVNHDGIAGILHSHPDGTVGDSPNCIGDPIDPQHGEPELPYVPPSLGDAIHNAGESAARAYEAKNEISDRFDPR